MQYLSRLTRDSTKEIELLEASGREFDEIKNILKDPADAVAHASQVNHNGLAFSPVLLTTLLNVNRSFDQMLNQLASIDRLVALRHIEKELFHRWPVKIQAELCLTASIPSASG